MQLETLAGLVSETRPEDFQRFAGSDRYHISSRFRADRRSLKNLGRVYYNHRDLKISFHRRLLGASIFYDSDDRTLLIRDVPEELERQL